MIERNIEVIFIYALFRQQSIYIILWILSEKSHGELAIWRDFDIVVC